MCTSVYPAIYICAYPECFWQVVTLVERPVICVSQFYIFSKKKPNFIKIEMYCSLKLLQLSQSEDFEILENNTTLLLFFFSLSCLISRPFDVATF